VNIALRKRHLDVRRAKCGVDRKPQTRRRAQIFARLGDPDQQGEVDRGLAEII
jgi:hypothetical protein